LADHSPYEQHYADVAGARVHYVDEGSGPPLLLLHGYPQTHLMWHAAAPRLADRFTVVAADLAGYGASFRPTPAPDHAPHSKRALAADQVQAMAALGHERFAVAGHDRGGRVAYRMALDHPDRVSAAAVLDVVPTGEVWSRADARLALVYWHWSFLAQPAPLPERLIGADPDAYLLRAGLERFAPEAAAEYRRCGHDPETIRGWCEDYRAAATLDRAHDDADRAAGRRIACPLLVLWGGRWHLERWYDVLGTWREWGDDVRGRALDCGHYLPEERPEEVVAELRAFVTGG
jgi:haloacetate dehalogenase